MIDSRRNLFFAFLIATGVAAGMAAIDVAATDHCGVLGCFEAGAEGEMWQALSKLGGPNDQAECINSVGDENLLSDIKCTRNGLTDVAPRLGQMKYPWGLAVDGTTIWVSDAYNHRVQAFLFDGTPIPVAHPIGNGIPGSSLYTTPADPTLTGHNDPVAGRQLAVPEGLAVVAGPAGATTNTLLVSDSYNSRIGFFAPDGSPRFGTMAAPTYFTLTDTVGALNPQGGPIPPRPTGIAATPGMTLLTPGTNALTDGNPANDNDRIVVTDRDLCFVYIYDAGFTLLRQLPEALPPGHAQGACVYPDDTTGQRPPLGVFSSAMGVTIDQTGRIYIAEYENSRVQVLSRDGVPITSFGTPGPLAPGQVPPQEWLQAPYSVIIDHRGRAIVADAENQRMSVYAGFADTGYTGPEPFGTFLFQLNAGGTLNSHPTAVAEQVGTGPGLDPAGRLVTTSTQSHQLQPFQLPDLAIVNAFADSQTLTGTFQVGVPEGKAADVTSVDALIEPVIVDSFDIDGAPVYVVDPLTAITAFGTVAPAQADGLNDIGPGQVVSYTFSYTTTRPVVIFRIKASGNDGGITHAPDRIIEAASPCVDCSVSHLVYNVPNTPLVLATEFNPPTGTWYNQQVFARITAQTTNTEVGLGKIAWQILSGPAQQDHGGWTHFALVTVTNPSVDVPFMREGASVLKYWSIQADGSVSAPTQVPISIDMTPPQATFTGWSAPNAAGWNRTMVSANYVVTDGGAGSPDADGAITFLNEGRDQFVEFPLEDYVENAVTASSNYSGGGGRPVNIDMTAPVVTAPANLIGVVANGPGGYTATGWNATASDPDLLDARPGADLAGSGVPAENITNPGSHVFPIGTSTWRFTATDRAGNESFLERTVTVVKADAAVTAPNHTISYGDNSFFTAELTPAFATGTVTFTFGPGGIYSAVANVVPGAGVATASVAIPLVNAGTYPVTVTYSGAAAVNGLTTTATLTVNPIAITVTAAPKSKVYGNPDPALTSTITTGALINGDVIGGSLTRAAGEGVGAYAISGAGLTVSSNYNLTYVGADLTITPRPVTIKADPQQRGGSLADPPFTYQITSGSLAFADTFSGALTRETGEEPGYYDILIGSLSLGPNYALSYEGAQLLITNLGITVRADFLTKEYDGLDGPFLSYSIEPELPTGISFSGELTRDPGNGVGRYYVQQGTLSLPVGYQILFHSGQLDITPKAAVVTAGDATKVYGTADPVLNVTSTGFLAADLPGITLSVSRPNTNEEAGTYSTVAAAAGDVLRNYDVGYASGVFTITPAQVTVYATPVSRPYGSPDPPFTFTYSNLPGGMQPADIDVKPTCTVAVAHVNVGAYPITCSGAVDNNLTFVYEPGVLTIQPKVVQLVINDKNRAFGVANPALDAVATGVEPGDTLAYTLSTTAGPLSPVGGYPITAQFAPGSNPNYNVQVTNGTLTVGVANVTLTINSKSKTYGNDNPALDATVAGLPAGAELNYTLETTATQASGVGGYPITAVLGANPSLNVSVVGATLTVDPRPIAVTANAGLKTYGTADPALTYSVTSGSLVGSDGFAGVLTRAAGADVGTYAIGQGSLALSANYTLGFTGANFTITPAPATVTAGGGTKVYGNADPVLGVMATGFLADDNITLSVSRASGENVFNGYVTTPAAAGAKLGNYEVAYVTGLFSITRRPATITAGGGTKVYGAADPVITAASSDFLPADNIVLTGSREAGNNVGDYDTFGVATGEAVSNYEITQVNGTFTITKAPATVTALDKTKVYGQVNPGLDATVTGLIGADALSYSLAAPTATVTSGVGNYPINVTLGENPNYEVTARDGILTVTAKPITVTATSQTKVYGDADPVLSYSLSGSLVGTDAATGGLTRAAGTNVGSYAITQGDLALGANYAVTFSGANLVITPKAASITALDNSKIEGTADPALLTTSTGFLPADNIVVTATRVGGEAPGTYVITPVASGGALGNYTVTSNAGVFTIRVANRVPVALNDSAVADGTAPVTIAVLANDSDADGDSLTVIAVTQPAGGAGTVTIVGNTVVFTPSATFAGSAIFTYTISDGRGGTATATVTVNSCNLAGYRTQSQGGWGTNPSGTNPGAFLAANFATVFPAGVQVGGTYTLRFTSAAAVAAFLPRGGTVGMLTSNGVNTTSSHGAGNFGGQVLALQISVAFSNAGVTRSGLSGLVLTSGPLAGSTVGQVLAIANTVLGGNAAALPPGMSLSALNTVVDKLNNNFVDGTHNDGYLAVAGCTAGGGDDDGSAPPTVTAPNRSNTVGSAVSVQVTAADPDDDTLTFSATGLPPGTSISSTGLITGTLITAGTYTVTVRVVDAGGLSSSATFVWTVSAASVNRPPDAVDDAVNAVKNTARVISVLANDTDPVGHALTIQSVTQPSRGTVVKNSNGTVTFTPKSNYTGTVTFSYTVSDGNGGMDTAKVTVSVKSGHVSGDGCTTH